jgi:anti-sigma regulatory factor (Ser/Thr protein kinase)
MDVTIDGGEAAPARAREAARRAADALHLNGLARPLELLVHELVTNSVRHADADTIKVSMIAVGEGVRVEVEDDGPGLDEAPPEPTTESEGGWGLHLVELMSSDWGFTAGRRACVWFELGPDAHA